jgi:hypothetical protein
MWLDKKWEAISISCSFKDLHYAVKHCLFWSNFLGLQTWMKIKEKAKMPHY